MDYHYIIETALFVAVVVLYIRQGMDHKILADKIEHEGKFRRDEYGRLAEEHWELCGEMRGALQELGLERTPARPKTPPGWRLPPSPK